MLEEVAAPPAGFRAVAVAVVGDVRSLGPVVGIAEAL
jgi:hypothetical protein